MGEYDIIKSVIGTVNEQPQRVLDESSLAQGLGLKSDELNKIFIHWSGVGLIDFFHFLSHEYIEQKLNKVGIQPTLFNFNSEENVHSQKKSFSHLEFCDIIPITDEDITAIRDEGVNYNFAESPFGEILIASSLKGVCYMAFADDKGKAMMQMRKKLSVLNSPFIEGTDHFQEEALSVFQAKSNYPFRIKLHLKGTPFQFKVWNELLKVPFGTVNTYHKIATQIGNPNAYRATGSAIARNWIAYILPCHRIIQSGGNIGQYMWGSTRKNAIIAWEAAKIKIGLTVQAKRKISY